MAGFILTMIYVIAFIVNSITLTENGCPWGSGRWWLHSILMIVVYGVGIATGLMKF